MKILVCGGAGYIGSHMLRSLTAAGHVPVVLDNLSTGHIESVGDAAFVRADLLDEQALADVFAAHGFDAVMHFCARSLVGESVAEPYAYYRNNVTGTLNLLEAMRRAEVDKMVFSSTAAVYGYPLTDVIDESHPTAPINPYGRSKLMVEGILADAARAYGLRSVSFRYFNAAGAASDAGIGEAHEPETHLIPNALRAAAGNGASLKVFGDDYPTPDGSCVRDYVHVDDIADAHLRALDYLHADEGAHVFNLGNERGFSVFEIVAAASAASGREIPYEIGPRRPGDPPSLVASSGKARSELGWRTRYPDIAEIISTAWRWHRSPRY